MRFPLRATIVALTASLLAACGGYYVPSTPRYPVRPGAPVTPPPPQYPIASETPVEPDQEAVLPPAQTAEVEAEPLPPLRSEASQVESEPLAPPVRPAVPPPVTGTQDEVRPGLLYVVQTGDTLSGVGRRFATPVRTLMTLNGIGDDGAIRVGARLILPAGARDMGPDPYATGAAPEAPTPGALPAPPAPPPTNDTPATRPEQASTGLGPDGFPTAAELARRAAGRFAWPVRGDILTRFGTMGSGLRSDGINIAADAGTEVRAAAGGQVAYAGDSLPGLGTTVVIVHGDGWVTAYSHLRSTNVRMEQRVTPGQVIGAVGVSGGVSQPQVHFEIRYTPAPAERPRPVDPLPLLPR
ncbi:MAG: M23 family metallopeptidase [Caulobacterales bacterium]|nr:M23 family metallopeptidase [Caulobacterales bacterium]